jgi:hypothetical protein
MAVYVTSHFYSGIYSNGQYTPYVSSTTQFIFEADGDTFSPGEIISIDGQPIARYIGFGGDGIVVQDASDGGNGSYYYYSRTLLESADPIPINSTDPLVYCFLAGTRIGTPTGSVAVEELLVGSLVLTAAGRTVPVRWLGRQTVLSAFGPDVTRWPVRLAAGALGPDRPAGDLCVTSDHALLLDGVLVQAGALVNGTTVRRMTVADLGDSYTVFHVETENHDLILAEGVPAETFVDNVSRRRFDNYAEFVALYGDSGPGGAEMDRPRIKSARQLPQSIRRQISDRASVLGWRAATAA